MDGDARYYERLQLEAERMRDRRAEDRRRDAEHIRRMRLLFGDDSAKRTQKRIAARRKAQERAALRELRNLARG
jgi:hypothetical protein